MGDTLSQPKKEKTTTSGQNDELKWAASEMQGWRRGMEDAHTTELDIGGNAGTHYFAVYDGHCVRFARARLGATDAARGSRARSPTCALLTSCPPAPMRPL